MGYKAVNIIMDKIENKSKGQQKILTDVKVVNKENINTYKQGDD